MKKHENCIGTFTYGIFDFKNIEMKELLFTFTDATFRGGSDEILLN
jgi:hypothetical protein